MKSPYADKKIDWVNTIVLTGTPILAIVFTILHFMYEKTTPALWIIFAVSYLFVGWGITGGYHRLFAHRTYDASPLLKLFYLICGAAAYENSALKWCADHRRHHKYVDTEKDPYNINQGFWWAHIGWVMFKDPMPDLSAPPHDLAQDKLVAWQHKHYLAISIFFGAVLPALAGWALGAPFGGLGILVGLRIVTLHHFTFAINSVAHYFGYQPYSDENSSKDNDVFALFSHGEGYHNFHHSFQTDYRNGYRWYQWDPTKWFIALMNWCGLASNVSRVPDSLVLKSRLQMQQKRALARIRSPRVEALARTLEAWRLKVEEAQKRFLELQKEYRRLKESLPHDHRDRLAEFKVKIAEARKEFQRAYEQWLAQLRTLPMATT